MSHILEDLSIAKLAIDYGDLLVIGLLIRTALRSNRLSDEALDKVIDLEKKISACITQIEKETT